MIYTKVPKLAFVLCLVALMTACESRTSGSLGYVEPDTPDAQPCGDGCPEGQTCVPNLDEDGVAQFICLDNAVAYCAPCATDDDCFDDRLLGVVATCVASPDGSGSFCATPCVSDDECPTGGHCELFSDGSSACLPDSGSCECSEWATERGAITECSISNAQGSCSGERSCGPDGLTECSAQIPTEELCDGLDNNCDGAVDDTFPEFGLECDGTDEDFCSGGTYFCVEGDLVCNDDEASIFEACNAEDDDCDGLVDEELTTRLIEDAQGVCRGSEETCEGANGWVAPDFTLIEDYETDEATCDGLDNDCDGSVDEAFTRDEGYIWATLDGVEDLFVGDECGAGICEGGEVQCNADGDGLQCSTSERAVSEVCDGLDNDCDGIIDNGIEAPLAAEQRGICAGLMQVCDETGAWVEPDYTSLPNYEEIELTCDGLDNDCDGEIDEGLSAPDADLILGVCLGAKKVCNGEAGWGEPDYGAYSDDYQIEEMWCDNLDNDCDGETDELFLEGGLISYTDLNGTSGLWKGDACGVGACGGGLVLCNDARTGLTCSTSGSVSAETCNGADDDCNGVIDNGFNLSTDEANCGACGVTCTNPHGNTQCADGICIPSCDPLWGDCTNPNDGCETQLTSVNNCGACGFVCDLPNAVELCTENGVCGIAACDPGWSDCDGIASNGCESYLDGDVNNCGGCGKTCVNEHGDAACIAGLCVANCDPGWASCDGSNSNGCETPLNTLTDCNGCGVVCGAPNADATCADYACAITQCDIGFEDCNSNLVDGCEINYLSDTNNCNGCGVVCDPANAAGVCNNGTCDIASCENTYCNLDGAAANGCEANLNNNPSCSGATNLGELSGDTGGSLIQVTAGLGEGWYKIRVTEDDGNWFSSADLSVTIALTDGGDTDYALLTRFDSCNGPNSGQSGDSQTLEWNDNRPIGGQNDSKDIYIFVSVLNATTCDNWTLSITGNTR